MAGDGLLQCLFMEENYVEAYGWALHMISKDAEYARGHHVIRYLRGVFQSTLPFIERYLHRTSIYYQISTYSNSAIVVGVAVVST